MDEQVNSESAVSPSNEIPLETNFQIKDIVLEKELASGLLARVYKGQQTLLQRTVAIKILSKKDLEDNSAHQRFQQEANLAANLDHPNIAKVLGFGLTSSGDPFLTMEYVEGITLKEFLDSHTQQSRSLKDFKVIFLPLLSALSYAHEKGIVHRDIKPGNIILTKSTQGELMPKLVDFGIAKVFIESDTEQYHTKTGTVIGTPTYMSPEQCLGKSIDGRSDLYSTACVMYEFLCGEVLFNADTTLALMNRHVSEAPPSPKSLQRKSMQSAKLCETILSALQKNPQHRPQTAASFSENLIIHLNNRADSNYSKKDSSLNVLVASTLLLLLTTGIIILGVGSKINFQKNSEPSKQPIFNVSTGSELAQLRKDKGTSKNQRSILARYLKLIEKLEAKRQTNKAALAEAYSQGGESIDLLLRERNLDSKDRRQLEQMGLDFAREGTQLAAEENISSFFFRCARNQFEILNRTKDTENQIVKTVQQANEHWPGSPDCIELTADGILDSLKRENEKQALALLRLLKVSHDEETEHIRLAWACALDANLALNDGDKKKALTLIRPVLKQFDSGLLMSPKSTIELLQKAIGPVLTKANRHTQFVELLKKEIETRPDFYTTNGSAQMCRIIAETYHSQNEKEKEIEYNEKALHLYERNTGDMIDPVQIRRMYELIIQNLSELNDQKYAEKLAAYKSKVDSMTAKAGTK